MFKIQKKGSADLLELSYVMLILAIITAILFMVIEMFKIWGSNSKLSDKIAESLALIFSFSIQICVIVGASYYTTNKFFK